MTIGLNVIYHFHLILTVCQIDLLSLIYIEVFGVGVEAFCRSSKREGEDNSKVLVILYVVFVTTELQSDTLFLQHFLS